MDRKENKEKEFEYLVSLETERKKEIQFLSRLINHYFQASKNYMNIFKSNQIRNPLNSSYKSETKAISNTSLQITAPLSHYNCFNKGKLLVKDQTEILAKDHSGSQLFMLSYSSKPIGKSLSMMMYKKEEHNSETWKRKRSGTKESSRHNLLLEKANHYSCFLYVGSLVQHLLKPWVIKYQSGFR
jgi:hypothetical protein